jgi:polar amino acid transport system permease protein
MISEVIALLKETPLIAILGGMDIMRKAQMLAAEQFTYFIPLCIAGGYYYGFVLLIEYLGKKIEHRGCYVKHS